MKFILALSLCWSALGQIPTSPQPMGHTTLLKALAGPPGLPGSSDVVVLLSSTSCVTAPSLPTSPSKIGTPVPPPALSELFIDNEAFRVNFVDSNTAVRVERAVEGTSFDDHAAGALVWCGPAGFFGINDPFGPCNPALIPVLPLVVIPSGQVWTCSGGMWVPFSFGNTGGAVLSFPPISDGDISRLTFSLFGTSAGDQVLPGWPSTLEAGLVGMMRIVSDGVVEVAIGNWSGATVTPAVQFFQATVGAGADPASAVLTFPSIPDGDMASLTFPLTGATAGGVVIPGFPASLESGLMGSMYVSATNTISVRLWNASGHTITPATQTFMATFGALNPVGFGSASLTYGAISDGDVVSRSFTVAGATPGTMVQPGLAANLETGLSGTMLATGANTVSSRIVNLSGGSVTPAVEVFSAATF